MNPGDMLGPYRVLEVLGVGGMGEVYKARDTRLDRSVAIKVLPARVSADPECRARFEREAKIIAGLNHPHVCTLHDVGEHPSAGSGQATLYLVMEHLTGETLAERLTKGPLPVEQALTVATEIADALSAAHRQGVIHRDLKPGNVMLTKAGAKLLDFGLAKLKGHGEKPAAAQLASVPTQSTPLTGEGMILGTLQYMAPEQLEGKPADARTDLWALGAILYEMLSGRRVFEGTSAASLITAIMGSEPPALATLQPLTPPGVDRVVRRCLAKSPDDRWDSAHDVADELRWLRETSGVVAQAGVRPLPRRHWGTIVLVAAVSVAAMVGGAVMWVLRSSVPLQGLALTISPAEEVNGGGAYPELVFTPGGSRTALTWTPDGQALVFVGRRRGVQQLYMRRLDADRSTPISGTEDAQAPVVSPDGQWVAFWARRAIRKVPLEGGLATELVVLSYPPGRLAFDGDGGVFFDDLDLGVRAIPANGKATAVTTVVEGRARHLLPSLLPGGRVLLYTERARNWSWGDEKVVALTLATGDRKVLLEDATDARYVPTGHLVFLRRGVLFAVPFDAEGLQPRGAPVPILEDVAQALTEKALGDVTGAGQYAVAPTGALAWIPSKVRAPAQSRLVVVDRRGVVTAVRDDAHSYKWAPRVSPDGLRLAVTIQTITGDDLWICDLTRRPAALRRVTTSQEVMFPMWGRGGRQVLCSWLKDGQWTLAALAADTEARPQVVVSGRLYPSSVAQDGRIAAVPEAPDYDILGVTVENGKARVEPLISGPHTELWPAFSPDGRWLLYGSDATGRFEVYVRPYPGPGEIVQVSSEGGGCPVWHPTTGREIFFLSPDRAGKRRMLAVTFTPGSPPVIGHPVELFSYDETELGLGGSPIPGYDVASDGQRFYAVQHLPPAPTSPVTHINLIQSWFEELKAKGPRQ